MRESKVYGVRECFVEMVVCEMVIVKRVCMCVGAGVGEREEGGLGNWYEVKRE